MTIKEATTRKHSYKVLATVKSNAHTLYGINKAIERETSITEWFANEAAMKQAEEDGFISFHDDGFILWFDGSLEDMGVMRGCIEWREEAEGYIRRLMGHR